MRRHETILYATDGPMATLTLNRPDALHTLVLPMAGRHAAEIGLTNRAAPFAELEATVARTAQEGVRAAVADRDGPCGDYGRAPDDERPDPSHVVRV